MTLLPLARAYTQILESIPKDPFPIEISPQVLRSIEERVHSLGTEINDLSSMSKDMLDCEITIIELINPHRDSSFFLELLLQYLRSQMPLPKEAILNNLKEATPFLTSSLKISPDIYIEYLKTPTASEDKCLPSKTLEIFHAHACGHRMEKHQLLGAGTFGAVFRKTLNGISFASKEKNPSEVASAADQVESTTREACAYSLFKHPNILELLGFRDNPCELHLEYANNSTLDHLIKAQIEPGSNFRVLPTRLRCRFSIHIAGALDYLHTKGFTHCDVKTDNILVDNDNFKLGDFGFVTYTKNNKRTDLTPDHAAPETIQVDLLSEKSDVWAYATILYRTFKNQIPYTMQRSDNRNWDAYRERLFREYYNKPADTTKIFENGNWEEHDPGHVFRNVIESGLHGNPRIRSSMKRIFEYLNEQDSVKSHCN